MLRNDGSIPLICTFVFLFNVSVLSVSAHTDGTYEGNQPEGSKYHYTEYNSDGSAGEHIHANYGKDGDGELISEGRFYTKRTCLGYDAFGDCDGYSGGRHLIGPPLGGQKRRPPTNTPPATGRGGSPVITGGGSSPAGESEPQTNTPAPTTTEARAAVRVNPSVARGTLLPESPRVTEYMIHDCNTPCGTRLPQWIEIHNPNPADFQVERYKLYYAKNKNEIADTPVAFSIKIPANGAIILATHNRRSSSTPISGGIEDAHVKVLNIPNTLGYGWRLTDADNTVIHQIGGLFTGIKYSAPFYHKPGRVNGYRQSTKVIASEAPTEKRYFGFIHDVSHPTFHKDRVSVAAAPTSPFRHRVLTTSWASLKKRR